MKLCTLSLVITITAFTICISGCPIDKGGDNGGSPLYYIDAAISTINGPMDDQINSPFLAVRRTIFKRSLELMHKQVLVSNAWANSCARPAASTCTNDTRETMYNACTTDENNYTLSGNVLLSYTGTPTCSFSSVGDTVTRLLNTTKTLTSNSTISTSSDSYTDRRGITFGGGSKLTITGTASYELDILGIHKTIETPDRSLNLLIKTTAPLSISGGLDRTTRTVTGGILEVIEDHREYPAYTADYIFMPNNLTYSPSCCYPVAGSLEFKDMLYESNKTGTISFSGCGTATLSWDARNEISSITLLACE